MANHANARKANRQNVVRAARNKSRISKIRTLIKKVLMNITGGNKKDAETSLSIAQSEIMRGVKKNIIKKNTASRRVSRLAHKIKAMDEASAAAATNLKESAPKKKDTKAPAKKPAAKKASPTKKSDKKEA